MKTGSVPPARAAEADHRGGLGKGRGLEVKQKRRQDAGKEGGSTPPPRHKDEYGYCHQIGFWLRSIDCGKEGGGGLATGVDIKLVAMYAVKSLAASVIFVHNHPSGNNTPSTCDKQLTEKMRKGLQLLGIKLLDSIILTEYGHYSMCDEMEPCIIR